MAEAPQRYGQYVAAPDTGEQIPCIDVSQLYYMRRYFGGLNHAASEMLRLSEAEAWESYAHSSPLDTYLVTGGNVAVMATQGIGSLMASGRPSAAFGAPRWASAGNKLLRLTPWIGNGVELVSGGVQVRDALEELDGYRATEAAARTGGFIAGCTGSAAVAHWAGSYVPVLGNAIVGGAACLVGGTAGAMLADEGIERTNLGEVAQNYLDGMRDERIANFEASILGFQANNRYEMTTVANSRPIDDMLRPIGSVLEFESAFIEWGTAYENKLSRDREGQGDFRATAHYYHDMERAEERMQNAYYNIIGAGNTEHNSLGISREDSGQIARWKLDVEYEMVQLRAAMGSAAEQDSSGHYSDSLLRIDELLQREGPMYLFSEEIEAQGLNEQALRHYRYHERLQTVDIELTMANRQINSWRLFNGYEGNSRTQDTALRDALIEENRYLITEVLPGLRDRGTERVVMCDRSQISAGDYLFNGGEFSPDVIRGFSPLREDLQIQ